MTASPIVSVVIPCYNAEKTIRETIRSVAAQSFSDLEIIVINDGSRDGSLAALRELEGEIGGRLKVFDQENVGQTVSRNRGIAAAQGRYIAFLDADDLWEREKLARQIAALEGDTEIGLCYSGALIVDADGTPISENKPWPELRGRCFEALFVRNHIVASSVVVRRSALAQAGHYDERLRACENWHLWTRIALASRLEFIPEPLIRYRRHPGNMSKDIGRIVDNSLAMFDLHEQQFAGKVPNLAALLREARYRAHSEAGRTYLWHLNMSAARRHLVAAIRLRPESMTCYGLFLRSLLGATVTRFLRQRIGA